MVRKLKSAPSGARRLVETRVELSSLGISMVVHDATTSGRKFPRKFPESYTESGSQISSRISGNLGQGQGALEQTAHLEDEHRLLHRQSL